MTKPSFSRARLTALLGGALACAGALTFGCLERPVVPSKIVTTNVLVDQILNKAIDKIDLLFVIDNSVSMADKQSILEAAVPQMVTRLVTPDCVTRDAEGLVTGRTASTPPAVPGDDPGCTSPFGLEFSPINDIHIGVITSSLGGHGSDECLDSDTTRNFNDRSYLVPSVRAGVPNPTNQGFLVWYPTVKPGEEGLNKPVEANLGTLTDNFKAHVVAAGERGCGFEAPLEAWYRFLVDPSPPRAFQLIDNNAVSTEPDSDVLAQRAAFLRSDSLVAIVVLTDENDCSVMEGGSYYPLAGAGWRVTNSANRTDKPSTTQPHFPVATPVCETNPNDPCCFSCLLNAAPSVCKDPSAYNLCAASPKPRLPTEQDRPNARCFQNKRRFGIDLLYPTQRYVDGLTKAEIVDSQTGERKPNPLLTGVDGKSPRDPSFVFLAGIVGVPWQDISTDDSYADPARLKYLNANELKEKISLPGADPTAPQVSRWDIILGNPYLPASATECRPAADGTPSANPNCGRVPVAPLDPFMIESQDPRSGVNPLHPELAITQAPTWNDVNGHEYDNRVLYSDGKESNDDLQFACIFPLSEYPGPGGVGTAVKVDCQPGELECDCGDEPTIPKGSPLCKENASSAVGTTQYWGKAYPAPRVLQVLKDFGENSILASICPKISDDANPDYGYNPAVGAIVDRLAEKLGGQCLPRTLGIDEQTGEVGCKVVEVLDPAVGSLNCAANGRSGDGIEAIRPVVIKQLLEKKQCATAEECEKFYMCFIEQLSPNNTGGTACLTAPKGQEGDLPNAGYCYVDPDNGRGDPSLVSSCKITERRLLRFVGADTPLNNSITFIACSAGDEGATATPPPAAGGAGN